MITWPYPTARFVDVPVGHLVLARDEGRSRYAVILRGETNTTQNFAVFLGPWKDGETGINVKALDNQCVLDLGINYSIEPDITEVPHNDEIDNGGLSIDGHERYIATAPRSGGSPLQINLDKALLLSSRGSWVTYDMTFPVWTIYLDSPITGRDRTVLMTRRTLTLAGRP